MGSSGSEEDGGDVTDNKTKRGFFGVICCIGAMRFFWLYQQENITQQDEDGLGIPRP